MVGIVPRILVPILGLQSAILFGLLVLAAGLVGAGLSPTPQGFVFSIFVVSVGCVCNPALQALLANLARPGERGALLGAVGSLNELTGAMGSTLYAVILGLYTSEKAPLPLPGMHFLVGAGFLILAWGVALQGFRTNKGHSALEENDIPTPDLDLM
uniref:Major facilitator superfamily (MFS) profile domain-containing protein n=2 Tax=Odontella aurita TaxID=265563 RepID=A0A7S4N6C5_9STRA|mmetsp:Transcript_49481/g.149114  ORF Transcript_49481/g.149114 Transcript_49481/m.149114 type:complete len:156 (+) Transcript_49481:552-1019(+)